MSVSLRLFFPLTTKNYSLFSTLQSYDHLGSFCLVGCNFHSIRPSLFGNTSCPIRPRYPAYICGVLQQVPASVLIFLSNIPFRDFFRQNTPNLLPYCQLPSSFGEVANLRVLRCSIWSIIWLPSMLESPSQSTSQIIDIECRVWCGKKLGSAFEFLSFPPKNMKALEPYQRNKRSLRSTFSASS